MVAIVSRVVRVRRIFPARHFPTLATGGRVRQYESSQRATAKLNGNRHGIFNFELANPIAGHGIDTPNFTAEVAHQSNLMNEVDENRAAAFLGAPRAIQEIMCRLIKECGTLHANHAAKCVRAQKAVGSPQQGAVSAVVPNQSCHASLFGFPNQHSGIIQRVRQRFFNQHRQSLPYACQGLLAVKCIGRTDDHGINGAGFACSIDAFIQRNAATMRISNVFLSSRPDHRNENRVSTPQNELDMLLADQAWTANDETSLIRHFNLRWGKSQNLEEKASSPAPHSPQRNTAYHTPRQTSYSAPCTQPDRWTNCA